MTNTGRLAGPLNLAQLVLDGNRLLVLIGPPPLQQADLEPEQSQFPQVPKESKYIEIQIHTVHCFMVMG